MRAKKRILSMLLTACLIVGMLPQTAFATEGATIGTSGLCEHHTAHDETCGYVEGTEGTPCTHEHTEDCSEKTTSCTHTHTADCYPVMDSGVSGNEATPSDAAEPICGHECSEESGCITEELNCTHTEHDSECGYIAAVEGHDCHYECAECAAPTCTCETDDPAIHATTCAVYVAPENPVCYCTEKCSDTNVWCDVCGFDYTQCGGTDTATVYADDWFTVSGNTVTIDGTLGGNAATDADITALVDVIKGYVDSGITTITVTGSNPAIIDMSSYTNTAIGEAISRLSGNGTHSADNQYNGKIDLILPDVTEIVDYEFQNAHALNSINLPKVTTIGAEGIYYCLYLQELTFGSVVTSIKEGNSPAFTGVGQSVDGGLCDLVLSCVQTFAATEYRPDLDAKRWWDRTWKSITLAHSGGEATCTEAAKCSTCNQPHGDVDSTNHTGSTAWEYDATHHWGKCACGAELDKETHSGGTATCKDKATCTDCKQPYGDLNSSNHTGGTEVRGKVEATTATAGYTGDTYCLGCNTKIATGTTIPKKDSGGTGGNTGGGDSGNDDSGDDTPTVPDDGDDTPADTPADPPATPVTVPVSGDENSIQVDAAVSGTTATIDHVDLSALNTVIGDHVDTGVVTIDFSVLNVEVDTVEIPADVVKQIAAAANDPNNDAESLEIILTDGTSIEFDAEALGEKSAQAGGLDITISIKHTTNSVLNTRQQQTIGSRPALDINVTSGGRHISDMGGKVSVHAPYELRPGEKGSGLIVYYVDDNGNRERCETSYDPVKKRVNWKTDHLSVYMIGYEEPQENPDTGDDTPAEEIPTSPDTGDDTPAYVTYTVQKGDTLWAIANKYGCTVSEIVAANSDLIKNPDLIYPGWQLKIPQAGATGADTNTPDAILPDDKKTGAYIVKRGDTLWAISKKYGCTVAEIVALNGELITDPDLIFAGWEIKIPQD